MRRPNIEVHIEELVLHSFAPGDRYAIADAVRQELSRLLASQFGAAGLTSSLTNNSEMTRVDAGAFEVAANARSHAIGAQIAQAIHGGITK